MSDSDSEPDAAGDNVADNEILQAVFPLPSAPEAEAQAMASSPSSKQQQIFQMDAGDDASGAGPSLHGVDTALVSEKAMACNLLTMGYCTLIESLRED